MARWMWARTLNGLTTWCPISALDLPSAARIMTSRSRMVGAVSNSTGRGSGAAVRRNRLIGVRVAVGDRKCVDVALLALIGGVVAFGDAVAMREAYLDRYLNSRYAFTYGPALFMVAVASLGAFVAIFVSNIDRDLAMNLPLVPSRTSASQTPSPTPASQKLLSR
jgi:hypothetical protein